VPLACAIALRNTIPLMINVPIEFPRCSPKKLRTLSLTCYKNVPSKIRQDNWYRLFLINFLNTHPRYRSEAALSFVYICTCVLLVESCISPLQLITHSQQQFSPLLSSVLHRAHTILNPATAAAVNQITNKMLPCGVH